jgi:hypothetical protein
LCLILCHYFLMTREVGVAIVAMDPNHIFFEMILIPIFFVKQ